MFVVRLQINVPHILFEFPCDTQRRTDYFKIFYVVWETPWQRKFHSTHNFLLINTIVAIVSRSTYKRESFKVSRVTVTLRITFQIRVSRWKSLENKSIARRKLSSRNVDKSRRKQGVPERRTCEKLAGTNRLLVDTVVSSKNNYIAKSMEPASPSPPPLAP